MFFPVIATAWGFAEATLFFIVPDVLLSFLALADLRRALCASAWAVAGSLIGGSLLYVWAQGDAVRALSAVTQVPAIGPALMQQSAAMLKVYGVWALFPGMLLGIPYKAFVVQASASGIGIAPLLLVTIPARLLRFAAVSAATNFIARRALRNWSARAKAATLACFWLVFYAIYFGLHYQK